MFSSTQSYHCSTPMKINMAKVDPTCAVAFYCSDQTDLWELISLVREVFLILWVFFFIK